MILIGITGIVGSGKTTVSNILRKEGLEVVDLDKIAKEVAEEKAVKKEIVKDLGGHHVTGRGINAKSISQLVFRDREALKKLENIIHPRVRTRMNEKIKEFEKDGARTVIVDAPLLFETGLYKELNKAVVVSASAEKIKTRLIERGMQEDDIKRRTAIQISLAEKAARADYIIHNDGTKEDLEKEVYNLLKRIKRWEGETNAP